MYGKSTATEQDDPNAPNSEISKSKIELQKLEQTLKSAQTNLLDRSLRNRLIHTNLDSKTARQVRIIDEKAEQIFEILRSGKSFTFLAGKQDDDSDEAEIDANEVQVYITKDDNGDAGENGVAARHRDLKLQTRLTSKGLQKKLVNLFLEGQTIEEEQGVNILYLALGFLHWREAHQSDVPRTAPLILVPVELIRDGARDRFKLKLRPDDMMTNYSLQAWLKEQFGISLPDLPEDDEWACSQYFELVKTAIGQRKNWSVAEDDITLGFFSFAKFLLWRDLDPANWPTTSNLTDSKILKTILLRDQTETDDVPDSPLVEEHQRIDDVFKPADLVHIADCDSSQAIAIQEALAEKNLVIQGPPGTGKSQTITNLIAGAVQRGKTVLFIAEKMAALNVVHSRLEKAKLGPICLELHSRKASKVQVLEQIKKAMSAPVPPNWSDRAFAEVEETQAALSDNTDRLHKIGSTGHSAYQLMGRMAKLKKSGVATPDFMLPIATQWHENQLQEHLKRLDQLSDRLKIAGTPALHPWRGIEIPTPDLLEQDRLKPLLSNFLESARQRAATIAAAADILQVDPANPVKATLCWPDALRHLGNRPHCDVAILSHSNLLEAAEHIQLLAQKGQELNQLKPIVEPYRNAFDGLFPDVLPPDQDILAAWRHFERTPDKVDELLLDEKLADLARELLLFIDASERISTLQLALSAQVKLDIEGIDWAEIRLTIAGRGQSWVRILSKEYREAFRVLRSISIAPIPKAHFDRIALLDQLKELADLRLETSTKTEYISCFGDVWKGDKSDWNQLRSIVKWVQVAAGFEPATCLRRKEILALRAEAIMLPTSESGQISILADLKLGRELTALISGDQLCPRILGNLWKYTDTDWGYLLKVIEWCLEAGKHFPAVKLLRPEVLQNSASALTLAEQLNQIFDKTTDDSAQLTNALRLPQHSFAAFDDHAANSLVAYVENMIASFSRITQWPPIRDDLKWLDEIGCAEVAERISDGRIAAQHVKEVFFLAASEAVWQMLRTSDPRSWTHKT